MGGSGSKNYLSGSNKPPKSRSPGDGAGASGGQGGGGAGGGSGSGGGTGGDICAIITNGTLRSPNPATVSQLSVGDDLAVQIVPVSGLDVLQAINVAGQSVGVIDTPEEQQLIDCILVGNQYKATITRIAGGAVTVRITRI